jgi:hypothetical protein
VANSFGAAYLAPDIGLLMAGRGLTAAAVAPLGEASNWTAAHIGSGTPRICQTWGKRGNTTQDPQWTVTDDEDVARWRLVDTRGATEVVAYVWGGSAAGDGEVYLSSSADTSDRLELPATPGLVGPISLTVDCESGEEVVHLHVDGNAAEAWVSAITVVVPPLSSPLPTGVLGSGAVGVDASELAAYETLSAAQGRDILAGAVAMRSVPHVYWTWSGVADTSLGADGKVLRSVPHVIPCIVWPDTDRLAWSLTVEVECISDAVEDTDLVVAVCSGPARRVLRTARITVPADSGTAWYSTTIRLRGVVDLAYLPRGLASCTLLVCPVPSDDPRDGADWQAVTGLPSSVRSTAAVRSVAVWGQ